MNKFAWLDRAPWGLVEREMCRQGGKGAICVGMKLYNAVEGGLIEHGIEVRNILYLLVLSIYIMYSF